MLMALGRRRRYLPQLLFCLQGFVGTRIALNYVFQLLHAFVLFAEFEKRQSFVELSGGGLVTPGEVLQNQFVVRDRVLEVAGLELNLG